MVAAEVGVERRDESVERVLPQCTGSIATHLVAVGAAIQAAHQDEGRAGGDRVVDFDVVPVDARREVANRVHHKTERERSGLLGRQIRVSALDEVVLPRRAGEIRTTVLSRGDSRPRTLRGAGLGWSYYVPRCIGW